MKIPAAQVFMFLGGDAEQRAADAVRELGADNVEIISRKEREVKLRLQRPARLVAEDELRRLIIREANSLNLRSV